MVERHARNVAAEALRELLSGSISNYEYEDKYPEAEADPALRAVFIFVWYLYSDMRKHKLTGKYAPSQKLRAVIQRCICFLKSDLEFQWPVPRPSLLYGLMRLLGLGSIMDRRDQIELAEGDQEVWPFFKKTDYVEALRQQESNAS